MRPAGSLLIMVGMYQPPILILVDPPNPFLINTLIKHYLERAGKGM